MPAGVHSGFWARGGVWVIAQFALMLACAAASVAFGVVWQWPSGALVGGLLIAIGAVYGLAGAAALGRHRTAFPAPGPATVFVEHGIYRLVRHPLYASVTLLATGWALCWASLPGLGVALTLGVFLWMKGRREEQWLQEQFPEYESYRHRVKSVIPWLL